MDTSLPLYQYTPLQDSATVRVLVLEPADHLTDILRAEIRHVNREHLLLDKNTVPGSYEVVSYCWGNPAPSRHILIGGDHTLGITENVDTMLRHLRSTRKYRILWIDAICLNQGDKEEKQVQVQLMGQIYAQAAKVHVWLGEVNAQDKIRVVFAIIQWMATRVNSQAPPSSAKSHLPASLQDEELAEAVVGFFNRPYFRRRWILQEVALAHHVTVHCGPHKMSWQWFIAGVKYWQSVVETLPGVVDEGISMTFRTILAIKGSSDHTLLALLWKFHASQCLVPHDRVFALHRIARDADQMPPASYAEHWSDTFARVVGFYFQKDKTSVWLHLASFGPLQGQYSPGNLFTSWVPDWRNRRNRRNQTIVGPDNNTALLSLNGFRYSIFFYSPGMQTMTFDCYYAGRIAHVETRTGREAVPYLSEGVVYALSEVLLSFFLQHSGSPTTQFRQITDQHDGQRRNLVYTRETLLSVLLQMAQWENYPYIFPSNIDGYNIRHSARAMLDAIWASHDVLNIKGKRDAIGLSVRGVQVGDLLVVPPQDPNTSNYWPYKGHPLFGIVVRPQGTPNSETPRIQPNEVLVECRYVGICCYALWEQECKEELDRISVQLV